MAGASFAPVTGCLSSMLSSNVLIGSPRYVCPGAVRQRRTFHQKSLTTRLPSSMESLQKSRNVICKISEDVSVESPELQTNANGRGGQKDSRKSELLNTGISFNTQAKPKDLNDWNIKFPWYSHISNVFLDLLERGVVWALNGSPKTPNYYMLGNYAPVEEFGPEPVLSVTGSLPECLNGELVRIGPNPKFKPVAKYHWFDGDGMLHGLRIKDRKVTYSCRYVRTVRFQQEYYWGAPKARKLGDLVGVKGLIDLALLSLRVKLGVLDVSKGTGTANTALTYHNGKLLALNETDAPCIDCGWLDYLNPELIVIADVVRVLEDGSFETVSRLDYDKKLDHPFTAHPKIDPVTGEMFTFGYSPIDSPYVTYRVISKDGVMGHSVPITVSGPIMMHDFAITDNYAIFTDVPLYLNPKQMVKENRFAYIFDETSPIRFGVLPRYAKDESQMQWFDCSSGFIFHTANAWEEGDEVVLIACRHPEMDLTTFSVYDKDKCDATVRYLWEYRFNLKTGKAQERMLGEFHVEFPRINGEYTGRKNRYVYTAIFRDTTHTIGIAKYDLTKEPELGKEKFEVGGNVTGVIWHGSMRYGSEPLYVPRNPGRELDEDDGYLLYFVFDENTWKSELIVVDAKTMSCDPVAVIEMPSRVPYGFHALFLTEEQLRLQTS